MKCELVVLDAQKNRLMSLNFSIRKYDSPDAEELAKIQTFFNFRTNLRVQVNLIELEHDDKDMSNQQKEKVRKWVEEQGGKLIENPAQAVAERDAKNLFMNGDDTTNENN